MRGSRALVTCPKLEPLMSPFGFMNCAWLNMLKNSARIWKDMASLTGMIFVIPKSVLLKPGPWKNRRFAVPKLPQSVPSKAPEISLQAVGVKDPGSKYVHVPGVARGFRMWTGPTTLGMSVDGLPTIDASPTHNGLFVTGSNCVHRSDGFESPI